MSHTTVLLDVDVSKITIAAFRKIEGVTLTAEFETRLYLDCENVFQTYTAEGTDNAIQRLKRADWCVVTPLENLIPSTVSSHPSNVPPLDNNYQNLIPSTVSSHPSNLPPLDNNYHNRYIRCFVEVDRFRCSQEELSDCEQHSNVILIHKIDSQSTSSVWTKRVERYIADVKVSHILNKMNGIDIISVVLPTKNPVLKQEKLQQEKLLLLATACEPMVSHGSVLRT